MSIIDVKTGLAAAICRVISEKYPQAAVTDDEIASMFEYPPDSAMGDLALPCFKLAKALRSAPPKIAADLVSAFDAESAVECAEAVNGYLNIKLSAAGLRDGLLPQILRDGADYGKLHTGDGKTAVFDYSSPNVAKPFHVGHLGSTAIGHSLKLIHEFAGWKTVAVNHLGDWGTQFGKLIVAYRKWGDRATVEEKGIDELVALYVRFHREAEDDPSLEDEARAEFTKLEQGDESNTELWQWFIALSIEEYKKTYAQLNIEFDYYTGESFYVDKVPEVLEILRDKKLLKLDQGASIVDLEEYNMPPALILKSDGSTIYAARDLAAAIYRKRAFDFSRCVYVTSAQQSLHFAQIFKVLSLMGFDWSDEMVHVPYGTVSIDGGKLATRTGNVVLLKDIFARATEKVKGIMAEKNPDLENADEVAEAVGVGAIVFHYLSNSRIKDINFVIDDVLSFEGNTGPYAQYTYARCASIIEKAGGVPSDSDFAGYDPQEPEKALMLELARFPEAVADALDSLEPMVITRYVLSVCAAFNRFYHECRIVGADDPAARKFRVSLTAAVKQVIGSALHLICLKTPEKI